MIRSTIVPMYYKDYFVNFAPEPLAILLVEIICHKQEIWSGDLLME